MPSAALPPPHATGVLFPFKPHHLELFYYVARHGGISAASRHMPYGIGQPAISGQMADFERQLGTRLFERRPFRLTEAGRLIYAHLGPFFDGLGPLWQQLRGRPAQLVRLAADEMLGQEFLPALLAGFAPRQPETCFELLTGPPADLEAWLHERHVHLVITATDRRPAVSVPSRSPARGCVSSCGGWQK